MLRGERVMPVLLAPSAHPLHRAREAVLGRVLPDDQPASVRQAPDMGEAEEVECRVRSRAAQPLAPEVDEARLGRVERKSETAKALPQDGADALAAGAVFEGDYKVVGVPCARAG